MSSDRSTSPTDPFEVAFERANELLYRHTSRSVAAFHVLLDQAGETASLTRARVLARLCIAQRIMGEYDEAIRLGREAMAIYEANGDDHGLAGICVALGNVRWSRGDLTRALAYYESALEIRRNLDDPKGLAGALGSVANILSELGRLDEARAHYEEALRLSEQLRDTRFAARTHNNLGECLFLLGQNAVALTHCETALRLGRSIGDRSDEPNVLINLGRIRAARCEWQQALDVLDEAAAMAVVGEDRRAEAEAMLHRAVLTEQRGRIDPAFLPQAELFRQEALKLAETIGAFTLSQQLHEHCAEAAERQKDAARATRHWAEAKRLRDANTAPHPS